MNEHAFDILILLIGIGWAAYVCYGWRKGEIRARGIQRRTDGPLGWWFTILSLAIMSGSCLYAGLWGLTH